MAAKDISPVVWIIGIGAVLYFGGFLNLGGGVTPTPQTHLACVSNVCSVVSGAGTNECTTVGVTCVPAPPGEYCDPTVTPSLDFLCRDIQNKGTSITCTAHYIRNSDGVIQTDDDGLNIALNKDDSIEYFVNSTGWYGVHGILDMPCDEEPRVTVLMKDDTSSMSLQFFAEDDNLVMSEGTNTEAVAAADTPSIQFKYSATTEDYVQDGLFFCQYDKTYYDTVLFNDAKGDSSLIPGHFVATAASGDEIGHDTAVGAWKLGDVYGTTAKVATVVFDTDDTNDATNYNVSCKIDDMDWYIDEDLGAFKYDSADENDADVGHGYYNVSFYTG